MTDRSANMRAIKSENTGPERAVRKLAHDIAPGYRLHRKDLPGKPDLAWIGRKQAVFVHGCFWHGHGCKRGGRVPEVNRDYWVAKIARNRARDEAAIAAFVSKGWAVEVIWECELKDEAAMRARLLSFLTRPRRP